MERQLLLVKLDKTKDMSRKIGANNTEKFKEYRLSEGWGGIQYFLSSGRALELRIFRHIS
jgi:hypothetical protein